MGKAKSPASTPHAPHHHERHCQPRRIRSPSSSSASSANGLKQQSTSSSSAELQPMSSISCNFMKGAPLSPSDMGLSIQDVAVHKDKSKFMPTTNNGHKRGDRDGAWKGVPTSKESFQVGQAYRSGEIFTNCASLLPVDIEFRRFVSAYPEYLSTTSIDVLRALEYGHLDEDFSVCLHYAGYGLFSLLQKESFRLSYISATLRTHALHNAPSEGTVEFHLQQRIFNFLNVQESEYAMVFTASRGAAFKLLAESYPFNLKKRVLSLYDYKSEAVMLLEEAAQKKGAEVLSAVFRCPSQRLWATDLKKKILAKKKKGETGKGLFVFPAQSRVTGTKYSFQWMLQAQENGWDIMLDASALGPSIMRSLGFSVLRPDYIVTSFFKVYGSDPTGFGCLLVKRSVIQALQPLPPSKTGGIVRLLPSLIQDKGYEAASDKNGLIQDKGFEEASDMKGQKSLEASVIQVLQQFPPSEAVGMVSLLPSLIQDEGSETAIDKNGLIQGEEFEEASDTNGQESLEDVEDCFTLFSYCVTVEGQQIVEDTSGFELQACVHDQVQGEPFFQDSIIGTPNSLDSTSTFELKNPNGAAVLNQVVQDVLDPGWDKYSVTMQDHLPSTGSQGLEWVGSRSSADIETGSFRDDQVCSHQYRLHVLRNQSISRDNMGSEDDNYFLDSDKASYCILDDDYYGSFTNQNANVVEMKEPKVVCRGLDHAEIVGLSKINTRQRSLINWLVGSMLKLYHPGYPDSQQLVQIYGPKVSYDRGPSIAFNLLDWRGQLIQPLLVQRVADKSNISLRVTALHHIQLPDSSDNKIGSECTSMVEEHLEGVGKKASIRVIMVALGFISSFEDVYKLWVFLAKFLDADFVSKQVRGHRSSNQQQSITVYRQRSLSSCFGGLSFKQGR